MPVLSQRLRKREFYFPCTFSHLLWTKTWWLGRSNLFLSTVEAVGTAGCLKVHWKDEPHFIYGISVEENCHQQWNTVFSYSSLFRAPPLSLLPNLQGLRLGPCRSMYWISSTSWCFIFSFLWYSSRGALKNHNKIGFLWSQSCIWVLWKCDVLPASTAVWQIWCKAADFYLQM